MKLNAIQPQEKNSIRVIVETPKGSVYKYDYNPEFQIFELNKIMPLGMVFPFDFGFIPNTRGGDGDPLDVLILMDEPALQGTLISCRPIAVLTAMQKERAGKEMRNDRIVAVAEFSTRYKNITDLNDLNKDLEGEIETFFKEYNSLAGKEFHPLGWKDAKTVLELVKKQTLKKQTLKK